jgi:hypothetical protein
LAYRNAINREIGVPSKREVERIVSSVTPKSGRDLYMIVKYTSERKLKYLMVPVFVHLDNYYKTPF